ncbi:MAG TPA: type ISP restriction/modification enzyme [Allosphingosinicella sp.]
MDPPAIDTLAKEAAATPCPRHLSGFPRLRLLNASLRRLRIGSGFIDNVAPEVWRYEVSGKNVLRQWFSYRKKSRERPRIGDRRPPSRLGEIQPDRWLPEYTTELINLLNVLGRLVDLEPSQAELLGRICEGPLIPATQFA